MVGPTLGLQLGCLAIVLLYLGLRLRKEPRRLQFLGRFALLMVASWLAEDTCIRAYGFYAYAPGWFGFIDQVPILIVAIWPVVIHSALDLVAHDSDRRPVQVALLGAAIVLSDAALIEPIAVRVGLWHWTEPGLFDVPPIGILGWAMFTAFAMYVLRSHLHPLWLVLIAPLGAHVLLLATWYGLFRHFNGTITPLAAILVGAFVANLVIVRLLRAAPLPLGTVMLRAPGALFFFALLILFALDDAALTVYAALFAVPWLVVVVRAARSPDGTAR